jgi:hypothetical protein
MKRLGLQQRRHPVVTAAGAFVFELRLELGYFVGSRLVPRDHDVEQLAIDREIADLFSRPGGHLSWDLRIKRRTGLARTAAHHGDRAPGFAHFEHAGDEPDGALVSVAFLEQGATRGQLADADFLGERGEVVALQTVERRESFEQLNAGFTLFNHVRRPGSMCRMLVAVAIFHGSTGLWSHRNAVHVSFRFLHPW